MVLGQALDTFASARAMLEALRQRRISSAELVELHLQRIERFNPRLNAIIVRAPDPRQAASQADAARANGDGRPLLGLPITLKESMNVRGLPTTVGVPDFKDFRSEHDGAIASSVLGAGAVLLGKTNLATMLADWQSDNAVYGRTVNPWNPGRTPGGSTGGGAAAVAAGLTPLEFGSDIGGSIRVPAAFCGIFGHKPSETAVPRSGEFPWPPFPNAGFLMGVQGPLARTAEDLELGLGLDVIVGPDVGEDIAWRISLPAPRAERLSELRIAVMPRLGWLPVSVELLDQLETLASQLAKAGAQVGVAQPDGFDELRAHHELYLAFLNGVTSAPVPFEERSARARRALERNVDGWGAARAAWLQAGIPDWLAMHARREQYRAAFRAFFRDWDVLLAPITLRTAFPHMLRHWPPRGDQWLVIDVDGQPVPYEHQLVYPALATLCGQPATAFPVGLSREGMPIGLQAIGPYLEDRTPIRFAALVAHEFGGYVRPPGYGD